MSRKGYVLAAVAALMLFGFTLPPAMAYFTCYTEAEGVKAVHFSDSTTFEEPEVQDWVKHLKITNSGKGAVFVRATAFAGSKYQKALVYSGKGWVEGDRGYWYYVNPVEPGDTAEELLVQINNVPKDEEVQNGDSFNVAVVYEAVPARYEEDGTPKKYNDPELWEQDLIVVDE